MAFERRVCVLRQVRKGFSADGSALTGAVYAERLGTELTVTPRIAALSSLKEGRYALFVWVDANIYCLELKGVAPLRIENAPSLSAGFAALLCFVRGEPEPVAYGRCGAAPERYGALLEEAPARKRPIPVPNPPIQTPAPGPNVPLAPTVPLPEPAPEPSSHEGRAAARYDDEAIAASDYFADAGDGDEKAAPAAEGAHGAAAPGDAGRPLVMTCALAMAFLSKTGWSSSSSFAGSQRSTAVFSSIRPSRSMSMAILTIAAPVRLPLRHWSIQSLPS